MPAAPSLEDEIEAFSQRQLELAQSLDGLIDSIDAVASGEVQPGAVAVEALEQRHAEIEDVIDAASLAAARLILQLEARTHARDVVFSKISAPSWRDRLANIFARKATDLPREERQGPVVLSERLVPLLAASERLMPLLRQSSQTCRAANERNERTLAALIALRRAAAEPEPQADGDAERQPDPDRAAAEREEAAMAIEAGQAAVEAAMTAAGQEGEGVMLAAESARDRDEILPRAEGLKRIAAVSADLARLLLRARADGHVLINKLGLDDRRRQLMMRAFVIRDSQASGELPPLPDVDRRADEIELAFQTLTDRLQGGGSHHP